ncbi:MAG: efflux RND transporter permease subunit, partial [Armatimonadota bacterium]
HRWYVFGAGFAALVAVFMFIGGGFQQKLPDAIKAGMGLAPIVLVIGVLVVIGNLIFKKRFNFKAILGTVVFILVFPAASTVGYFYGQWKKEAVFKFVFIPPTDGGEVDINIIGAPDASLAATDETVRRIEAIARKHPATEYVVANVGTQGGGFGSASQGTQFAQVQVTLKEKASLIQNLFPWTAKGLDLRKVKDTSVVADLTRDIGHVPGAQVTVTAGGGFSFGSAIQLAFKSDDRQKLLDFAVKVRDLLQTGVIKGVITPDISSKPGKQELRAIPDRVRAADANVSSADVGAALRTLYEGDDTVKFRQNGNEYPIRVMMDLADRDDPAELSSVPVAFKSSEPIYLSEVTRLEKGRGVDKITRRDRQETITVTAELLPGYAAGTVQGEINAWLDREHLIPEGVSYKALGQADAQAKNGGYLMTALFLGLILVYMVLASLFDNLLYPFIIQLAQPQAMVGALLALVLTDKTLNIVGMIGIIALIGLVGKNAILLVDYANTLRARGEDREHALVESGGTRLRPITMTTLALLFGMMPVALALGRGSEFRETIGITIIGCTLLSTVLTLLVIPCSYSIFDDIVVNFGKWLNRNKKPSVPVSNDFEEESV